MFPSINFRVVFNRPYRQYYTPVRYAYTQPYYNNYRRTTAVASRRGNTIRPNRSLATVRDNSTPRRGKSDLAANTPRRNNSAVSPRSNTRRRSDGNTVSAPRPRNNSGTVAPRSNSPKPRVTTPRSTPKPKVNTPRNTPKPRVTAPRSTPKPKVSTPRTSSTRPKVSTQKKYT